MNMIKAILEDEEIQELINDLAEMKNKEARDCRWYPKELAEIRRKIKIRGEVLKDNLNN